MSNWHPWHLKKSKSWEPLWCYQLNSTADLANLVQYWGKWAGLAMLAPKRLFILSIVLGAKHLSYMKSIATYALTSFCYIISFLASVWNCGECHLHVLVRACAPQNSRRLQVLRKNLGSAFSNWFYEFDIELSYKSDTGCCETSVKNQTYSNKHQNAEY